MPKRFSKGLRSCVKSFFGFLWCLTCSKFDFGPKCDVQKVRCLDFQCLACSKFGILVFIPRLVQSNCLEVMYLIQDLFPVRSAKTWKVLLCKKLASWCKVLFSEHSSPEIIIYNLQPCLLVKLNLGLLMTYLFKLAKKIAHSSLRSYKLFSCDLNSLKNT